MGELYQELKDRLDQEKGTATATIVQGETNVGAKLLILPGKRVHGSLGNNRLEALVVADAERTIWSGEATTRTYTLESASGPQSFEVFIEGFPPPPLLVIVGAGHIAIPLSTFAKTLNYRVVVVDARSAFATEERFPQADEVIVEWPDTYLEKADLLNPSTSVAVLTHDPKFDEPTLKVVLNHEVAYVGAIGSRKTGAERNERLRKQGLSDEQIARIHGPIGLNLGGASPEEMALAIMAEIVAVRHGKDFSRMGWQTK
ncbi:MAG TPA: XdhC/CoxI family protein [Ktedonobacteraceae bacterium]|nr:XdhC/CoxI family protein [Ktedonobacteraceae bacterium]